MRVIGCRKNGLAVLYGFVALLSLVLIAMGIAFSGMIYVLIMGLFLLAVAGYILVNYFRIPKEAILLLDDETLGLPKGVKVKLLEIMDVSYVRAQAKGVRYKWGCVILKTAAQRYRINYLADCEEVAKELTRLMYVARGAQV